MYNGKYKHIRHKYNTIKYLLLNMIIFIDHAKLEKNIVDLLIKDLLRELLYNSFKRNELINFNVMMLTHLID